MGSRNIKTLYKVHPICYTKLNERQILNLTPGFVLGLVGVFIAALLVMPRLYGLIRLRYVPLIFISLILGYYIFKTLI